MSQPSDCAAATPQGTAPGEAGTLRVARDLADIVMEWSAPDAGCLASGYSVYRGDLATLRDTGYDHDTVLSCVQATTSLRVPEFDPAIGVADYYLVVPDNSIDEGSYGRDSSGVERPASLAACRPTQSLAACTP